ncbi:MAG: MBOAT family protein, partial [Oscillospiraceae bacterium]|nr:MBOAT family protein [Oscillospiraceae bacterium]
LYYLRSYGVLLVLAVVGSTPLIRNTAKRLENTRSVAVLEPVLLLAALLVCSAYLVDGSFNPFLYFRF